MSFRPLAEWLVLSLKHSLLVSRYISCFSVSKIFVFPSPDSAIQAAASDTSGSPPLHSELAMHTYIAQYIPNNGPKCQSPVCVWGGGGGCGKRAWEREPVWGAWYNMVIQHLLLCVHVALYACLCHCVCVCTQCVSGGRNIIGRNGMCMCICDQF